MRNLLAAAAALAAMIAATAASAQKAPMTNLPTPPRAEQRPTSATVHGTRLDDPYAWLRDKGYPKVDDKDVIPRQPKRGREVEGQCGLTAPALLVHKCDCSHDGSLAWLHDRVASWPHVNMRGWREAGGRKSQRLGERGSLIEHPHMPSCEHAITLP